MNSNLQKNGKLLVHCLYKLKRFHNTNITWKVEFLLILSKYTAYQIQVFRANKKSIFYRRKEIGLSGKFVNSQLCLSFRYDLQIDVPLFSITDTTIQFSNRISIPDIEKYRKTNKNNKSLYNLFLFQINKFRNFMCRIKEVAQCSL